MEEKKGANPDYVIEELLNKIATVERENAILKALIRGQEEQSDDSNVESLPSKQSQNK